MSGICALVDFGGAPIGRGTLDLMLEASPHRGPDGSRCRLDGSVGFAHQALHSTPESVDEVQPFVSLDGRVCVVADVRIDNRDELHLALRPSGHLDHRGASDVEYIHAAYRHWGPGFPDRIVGDFAVAVWDEQIRSLLCARDALGVKPLHYAVIGQRICVASEAQQVLAHPGMDCRLDERTLAEFLVGLRQENRRTMFRDVRRLSPGHCLLASASGVRRRRYWNPSSSPPFSCSRPDDYAESYLEILKKAVTSRLRTQAERVAILMSGGLDSCSVAAVAADGRTRPGTGPEVRAHSLSFERLRSCDERRYSREVAEELGVPIEYTPAERFPLLECDEARHPPLEGPLIGWEAVYHPMRLRMRETGARVALTGHVGPWGSIGNDRLGYAHRLMRGQGEVVRELRRYGRRAGLTFGRVLVNYLLKPLLTQSAVRRIQSMRGHPPIETVPDWMSPEVVARTGLRERLSGRSGAWRLLHPDSEEVRRRFLRIDDVGWAVYLDDRGGHRCGLEMRHPFLDRRLVEFVARIPPEEVFTAGWTRMVLRRATKGLLPDLVRLRPDKTKFHRFLEWCLRASAPWLSAAVFADPWLARLGLVDGARLLTSWEAFLAGAEGSPMIWFPICAELWLRENHGRFSFSGI